MAASSRRCVVLLSRHLYLGERPLEGPDPHQEHTPAKEKIRYSRSRIGFSGTCDEEGALLDATALAGKRSLRLTAVLKLMRRA